MQTQYQSVALHPDPFTFTSQPPIYPLHSDHYLASAGEVDFTRSFLGGSSPSYNVPHEDSRYIAYRGEGMYRAPTTTIPADSLNATGMGFSGNNNITTDSLFHAEELATYVDTTWSWNEAQGSAHGVVAPVPLLPIPPEVSFLPIKSKEALDSMSIVRSPGPPLPTPAAMAILLSSRSRSDIQSIYDGSTSVGAMGTHEPLVEGITTMVAIHGGQGMPENTSREKKHACTMCHKRFDRPSTLRKHLLVHTGEKAFVCDICGRRFGVASNLNRHVKRCALKPVNMTTTHKTSPGPPSGGEDTSPQTSPVATSPGNSIARSPPASQKRGSFSSSCSSATSSPPRGRTSTSPILGQYVVISSANKPTKRRRRAPSRSRWVPLSLLQFNLSSEDYYRSVQIPMPPVRRNLPREERDSWDENTSPLPYHPDDGWRDVLPGPGFPPNQGLKAREVSKFNFGSGGTASAFTVGRVMVF